MHARAQVIPFEEERTARRDLVSPSSHARLVPPEGAEVIPFRTKGASALLGHASVETRTSPAPGRRAFLAEESGQGTTEYAILVGVLVVIAIMAILIFRDKVQELWTTIADGINSL